MSPRRIKPSWGHHTYCCPRCPCSPMNLPGHVWGFALNVGNSVNEVGFPPGQGCFRAQLWGDHCWKSGTLSLSLSPPPGAAGREACGCSLAPLGSH